MKKTIAIMTWHHVQNYGTAYQAFALKKVIESLGAAAVVIDYRRVSNRQIPRRRLFETLKKKILSIIHVYTGRGTGRYELKKAGFEDFFEKYFTYTSQCKYNQDFMVLNKMFDGFVCGSDQIWGPEWFNPRYFLDFVTDEKKLIAYAPSIGVRKIHDRDVQYEMARLLKRFHNLSLREKTGCQEVRKLLGEDNRVINVLDPVFLLTLIEWRELEDDTQIPKGKYAFIFFLKNNVKSMEYAVKSARKMHLTPIVMHSTQSEDNAYANIEEPSPEKMLAYIGNADYIFTDSFHVTVLSIIFHKEFLVFNKNKNIERNGKNSRIIDLLEHFGIEDRIYAKGREITTIIDYDKVQRILNRERERSLEYLKSAVNSLPVSDKSVSVEQKICECEFCQGKVSEVYDNYSKQYNKHWILKRMERWNFLLCQECYECKNFTPNGNVLNKRKPIFYYALEEDLKMKKSPLYIYMKYYLLYDLPKICKDGEK